jgi:hypothetical protein
MSVKLGMVTGACNLTYLGCHDQEDHRFKTTLGKMFMRSPGMTDAVGHLSSQLGRETPIGGS